MSQGSTKLEWVTRSKEILGIAQNRIEELNQALRFEQQLRDEEQKKLDELADENDYEKRLDQLWVVKQIDERLEYIRNALQLETTRTEKSEQPAKKELGSEEQPELDDSTSEAIANMFDEEAIQNDIESQKLEELKRDFEETFKALVKRISPEWKPSVNTKRVDSLTKIAQQCGLNKNYQVGMKQLGLLRGAIEICEKDQANNSRHDKCFSSIKNYKSEESREKLSKIFQSVAELKPKVPNGESSNVGETFNEVVLSYYNKFINLKPSRKNRVPEESLEFMELQHNVKNFIKSSEQLYNSKDGLIEKAKLDDEANFSTYVNKAKEIEWTLTQMSLMAEKKEVSKLVSKLEKCKDIDDKRQLESQFLLKMGTSKPSNPGASASLIISDMDKKPAYIFKPSKGEMQQPGWPPGGGAPREVMFSRINDFAKQTLGLDFGVCGTSGVVLKDKSVEQFSGKKGAPGIVQEMATCTGDLGQLCGSVGPSRETQNPNFEQDMARINTDDLQKIALLDFLTLNLDRQLENVLVNDTGGEVRLIPIDAGNAIPPRGVFDQLTQLGNSMTAQPYDPKVGLKDGQNALAQMPQAQSKFSPEMLLQIEKLDPEQLIKSMMSSEKDLPSEMQGKIEPESLEMIRRSARFLKLASKELTVYELSNAYAEPSGFKLVLEASEGQVDAVINEVISSTKTRVEQLLTKVQMSEMINEFLATYQNELVDLGWDRMKDVARYPEQMMEIRELGLRKGDAERQYEASGGDIAYISINPKGKPTDFIFDKLSTILAKCRQEALEPERMKELTKVLGWKKDEVLNNLGWVTRILDRKLSRDSAINLYKELGGDELLLEVYKRDSSSCFLVECIEQLEQFHEPAKSLGWETDYLKLHLDQISRIIKQNLKGDELFERYNELGGDVHLLQLNPNSDVKAFVADKVIALEQLLEKIRKNKWGEPRDLATFFPKWGLYLVSNKIDAALNNYVKLGGDELYMVITNKQPQDAFVLDRMKVLEDVVQEYSRNEFRDEIYRASQVIREGDTKIAALIKDGLKIDSDILQFINKARLAINSGNVKEAERFVIAAKQMAKALEMLHKNATQIQLVSEKQFSEILPSQERAKTLGLVKEFEGTVNSGLKLVAEVDKFVDLKDLANRNLALLDRVIKKEVDEVKFYAEFITAEVKRLTLIEAKPSMGLEVRLDTGIRSIAQLLVEVEKEEDNESQMRRAKFIYGQLEIYNADRSEFELLLNSLEQTVKEMVKNYPDFVSPMNPLFQKSLGDVNSCLLMIEEFRRNNEVYKKKSSDLMERIRKILNGDD